MPTISIFYGILVLMYFRDNRRHHLPHVHVRYQGDEALGLNPDEAFIEASRLPPDMQKDVSTVVRLYRKALGHPA